jgi:hypothetical protein
MVAVGCGGKGVVVAKGVTRTILQNGKRVSGVLVTWNQTPTVAGGMSTTGDAMCPFS